MVVGSGKVMLDFTGAEYSDICEQQSGEKWRHFWNPKYKMEVHYSALIVKKIFYSQNLPKDIAKSPYGNFSNNSHLNIFSS